MYASAQGGMNQAISSGMAPIASSLTLDVASVVSGKLRDASSSVRRGVGVESARQGVSRAVAK